MDCFNSCLAQKKTNDIEIIIGDDGSSDGSIELIKELKTKYPSIVRYFVNDRNDGVIIPSIRVSNTIKKAIQIANGRYCVCISGDDVFLDNDYLSTVLNIFQTDKKNKYSAVVAQSLKYFWNNGEEKKFSIRPVPTKVYWSSMYMHLSCFVFKLDSLENHLLERFCDDTGLEYSLACCGKWKFIDRCVFGYRQRDFSIMHSEDKLGLMLLELLLFQDCLNHKKFTMASFSRFYKPLVYVKHNLHDLNAIKHAKYIEDSKLYKNDIISLVMSKGIKLNLLISLCGLSYFFYRITRLIYSLKNKVMILLLKKNNREFNY